MTNEAADDRRVCAICGDQGVGGATQVLWLGFRTRLQLCGDHASAEFQSRRDGRDFVEVLTRLWLAHGCLTAGRRKALAAHLRALAPTPRSRQRPGSYAWGDLRRQAEAEFAGGALPRAVHERLEQAIDPGLANLPSLRTVARWHAQRRWVGAG